jgi:hypothetical protein
MAGSCVWGVDREAIEQRGNTMCVFVSGFVWRLSWGLFFLGNIFPAGSLAIEPCLVCVDCIPMQQLKLRGRYLCPPTPKVLTVALYTYGTSRDLLVIVALMLCWTAVHPLAVHVRVCSVMSL